MWLCACGMDSSVKLQVQCTRVTAAAYRCSDYGALSAAALEALDIWLNNFCIVFK